MSDAVKIGFVPFSAAPKGVLVLFTDETLKFGPASAKILGRAAETVKRAAAAGQLQGQERQHARYSGSRRPESSTG